MPRMMTKYPPEPERIIIEFSQNCGKKMFDIMMMPVAMEQMSVMTMSRFLK